MTGPTRSSSPVGRPVIGIGGQLIWSTNNDKKIIENGYLANDIVYSIISLITAKAKVAPWDVYQVVDESSLKKYHAALQLKHYKEALDHRTKALELVQDEKLKELLDYPNEQDSWSDLIEQAVGFKLLTGDKYLYGQLISGGANDRLPNEIYVLPSHLMQIYASNDFPAKPSGYAIACGYVRDLTTEEILHEKYWNPDWTLNGSQLYGLSPLKAAAKNIDRSNSAKETSTRKFKNGGVEGILYNDDEALANDADLSEEQIGAMKKKWEEEYGGPRNAGKIVMSGYKMGWQGIGLSPVDLAIIEAEKWDLRMICNIYGVPSELVNDPDTKTHANRKTAEKALTSRCAIPQLVSHRDSFNRKLKTDWGYAGKNRYIDFDISVYSELQEDQKDRAEWMGKGPLTIRQWYELREIETPKGTPDGVLDMMLVPSNLRDVDSLGLAVPDISSSVDDLAKMKLL